jgi:hypothetical protein
MRYYLPRPRRRPSLGLAVLRQRQRMASQAPRARAGLGRSRKTLSAAKISFLKLGSHTELWYASMISLPVANHTPCRSFMWAMARSKYLMRKG